MNAEFSQRIMAIPVANAPGNIVPPFTGFDEFHSDIALDPICEVTEENGNQFYKFSLRITQRGLSSTIMNKYKNRRPAILVLFDTAQNYYVVGNAETPVRAIINPVNLSNDIKFAASLINSPF